MDKQKQLYIKEYSFESGLLVAVCDKELVGKNFEEGGLSLKITEHFYKGEEASEREATASLKRATIANLVGKRAVQCALENDLIEETSIISVDGVPHAQMVKL